MALPLASATARTRFSIREHFLVSFDHERSKYKNFLAIFRGDIANTSKIFYSPSALAQECCAMFAAKIIARATLLAAPDHQVAEHV